MKKVVVVIVGGVVTSLAQADIRNVDIYGRLHGSVESRVAGNGVSTRHVEILNNSSRIGLRGSHEVSAGQKIIWQVESGFALDDGSGTGSNVLAGRETFLGFSNGWGALKVGNFYDSYDDLRYIASSVFQLSTGSSNDAALWANGADLKTGGFDNRARNSISYETPRFFNTSAEAQYSRVPNTDGPTPCAVPCGGDSGKNGAYTLAARLTYDDGALRLGVGHRQNRRMRNLSSNFYQDGKASMVTAGYKFGAVYVAGLSERIELDDIGGTANDRTRNYGSLLGQYTVNGKHIFSAFYGRATDWSGSAAVAESGAKMKTVAYNYVLSPQAQVYVIGTRLVNEARANYVLGGSPVTTAGVNVAQRVSQSALLVGAWYNF